VLAPALTGSADGGAGQFGFEVPRGDPGAIEAAARGVRDLGGLFSDHARAVGNGARVAIGGGGWQGSASGAFSDVSGNLLGVLHGNASACDTAASVLDSLSRELEHAQSVTRQALADCQRAQQELTTQQHNAETAGQEAQTASQNAASAVHPAQADVYRQQAVAATHQAQGIAQDRARSAQGDLDGAMQRGRQAYQTYMTEASALGVRLGSTSGKIRNAPSIQGGSSAGFPLGGGGDVPMLIPPLQTSPAFTDPVQEPGPNILGDPIAPQGPTILADPIPDAGPTILADPIPDAGPTILADPIPDAGPTILANPIPEQLPGNGIVSNSGNGDTGASGGASGGSGAGGDDDGEPEVTFGHGARHLAGTGLDQADVDAAIEAQVEDQASRADATGSFWGRVEVDGQTVEYRAYTLPDGTINVGTYYVA
jgi:Putative T7SS secretion signal domain